MRLMTLKKCTVIAHHEIDISAYLSQLKIYIVLNLNALKLFIIAAVYQETPSK